MSTSRVPSVLGRLIGAAAACALLATPHAAVATGELEPSAETGAEPAASPKAATAGEPALRNAVVQSVARAAFTTGVVDREPVDAVQQISAGADHAIFFTELQGLQGQTIVHRWEWNGQVMAEVPFEVGGSRWRVYSTKRLLPDWAGQWSVVVVGAGGKELARRSVSLVAPAGDAAAAEAGSSTPTPPPAAPASP